MLKFNSLLVFSENPQILAEFYKKVFNINPNWEQEGYTGFQLGEGQFTIGPHDKVHGKNPNPERIIFNFETLEVKEEFERIKKIGAKVIKEPYAPGETEDMLLATFADPDGNYFQLASPMPQTPSSQTN